jgi:ribosome recycling factor
VKIVHSVAEQGRVGVRNVRRDVLNDMRELKKGGDAGSDEEHHGETELQKHTDAAVKEIDSLLKGKEEEILEV